MKKAVLAIGLDPAFGDFKAFPQLTPEIVRGYIDTQIENLRTAGYETTSCLIDAGETAEIVVTQALRSKHFDCIMIGAGLRMPPAQLLLFERVLNLVHVMAPDASICFNTRPGDSVEAVRRWVKPEIE